MKMKDFLLLEPVISKNDLLKITGKKDEVLKVSINRWIKQGFLKKAGERTGIYYNLIADKDWENNIVSAVLMKYPSAILGGPSVLHACGLQTQIPKSLWFYVLESPSIAKMEGVVFLKRERDWFENFKPQHEIYNVPALSPQQVINDFNQHGSKDPWKPDFDDIDIDELENWKPIKKNKFKC